MAAGHLQGDPAHEKISGENGKKSDEKLGEQVGTSFEKLTGKEKLHDFIHHGREGREPSKESCHQKRGGKGGEGKHWVKKKARRPIRKEPAPLTMSVP